jgi:histidine triad (HIT) family protein
VTNAANLNIPENAECAFCAYLSGRRPYTILARNASVAILVTREQRGVPHLLVIPTRHFETILDLPEGDACAVMLGVKSAAYAIDKAYGRPGISVWQNNGTPANQKIGHFHFHVAGTLDGGGTEWGDVPELSLDKTDAIAERLKPWI